MMRGDVTKAHCPFMHDPSGEHNSTENNKNTHDDPPSMKSKSLNSGLFGEYKSSI